MRSATFERAQAENTLDEVLQPFLKRPRGIAPEAPLS
jgi:hypothetical protein